MRNFWADFQTNRKLNSAIKKCVDSQDPSLLAVFISNNPSLIGKVIETANHKMTSDPWTSFWICLSLVKQDNNAAIDILKRISESDFSAWKRIRSEHQKMIFGYISKKQQIELFLKYSEKFDTPSSPPIEQITYEHFKQWFTEQLSNPKRIAYLRLSLITFLERAAFDKLSDTELKAGYDKVYFAGLELWNQSLEEESLEILRLLAAMAPNLFDSNTLETLAVSLMDLITPDTPEFFIPGNEELTRLLSKHVENDLIIPAIRPSVARTADILRMFPSSQWVDNLKTAWINISKYIRAACRKSESKQIPPALAMAGNALAIALGACYAKSIESVDIDSKDEQVDDFMRQLDNEIKQRNSLVDRFEILRKEYVTASANYSNKETEIENKIKKIKVEIRELEQKIEELHNQIEHCLSPAEHLLNTLLNGQDYPVVIQQAAACGLKHILDQCILTPQSARKIREALRMAVFKDDWNDDKLKSAIDDRLPRDIYLTDRVFEIASKYLTDPNQMNLINVLSTLGDKDDFRTEITNLLDDILSRINEDFAERMVFVFPNASTLEVEINLRDGLNWMLDLVEQTKDADLKRRLTQNLGWTVALMRKYLPQMNIFLERYPLRLMCLDHHKKILGKYNYERCDLIYWTRYQPPCWKPGMTPEEAGRVNDRYLSVDNRSTPNSMGIYYRLFEHPVLSLPVIYHEFLHFGGPAGNPSRAISNESEVWMREILFMQHLIASLSPIDGEAIQEYENEIIKMINSLGLPGLGMQIQYDFSNSQFISPFCDMIERIYGTSLTDEEAAQKIEDVVNRENRNIQLTNRTDERKLNWHPDIEWPLLNSDQTQGITTQYKAIQKQAMTSYHRLDWNRYKELLNDQACRYHLTKWKEYQNRQLATRAFDRQWIWKDTDTDNIIKSIVDRFSVNYI